MEVQVKYFWKKSRVSEKLFVSKQERPACHFVGNIMSATQLIANSSYRDKIFAIAASISGRTEKRGKYITH